MASIGAGGVLFEHDSKKTSEQPDLLMLVLVTQPRALIDSSPLTPFSFHHSAMFILHSLCVLHGAGTGQDLNWVHDLAHFTC